ncbi:nucleoside deaminase [Lysobacter gummosus]|uniref:Nucleoside deaminase n=1 Tax=Lysobacter gummosus TaxID=262324 RepID=A0ABY3XA87_9GAMM|nr:nucleoside deaminase [Lysobacter gummosus]ALN92815.1 cytidine and deoxycytidylate deaminase zinc-binding region [Lysobacter gummosus]UNP28361.1 nucleoside deaminase [Lysobacter gummosus]
MSPKISYQLTGAVQLALPDWIDEAVDRQRAYPGDEDKVALAVELSRRNIELGTGGPFGAAVFDSNGLVIGVGVNRVVPQNCSVAHAEMMAFMCAQAALSAFRLNDIGPMTLATSAQPCCMCYGASFWAGIDHLLIGARSEDVMRLTEFDEGPLPADWIGELERRGIAVRRDLHRDAACEVLRRYGESGISY